MKIVCLSDTHNCNEQIIRSRRRYFDSRGRCDRYAELLIEVNAFCHVWFTSLPHRYTRFLSREITIGYLKMITICARKLYAPSPLFICRILSLKSKV